MAFLDNPTIILAHIRQSHVTSDDTGMCEMVLIDHDVDLEKFNPSSAYGDSGSETQGSNGETQGYVYSQSVDITSSWDFGIRRRSNTAQRLERLRKERQNQIKCKNIQWKDRNTSYSAEELSSLFEKKNFRVKSPCSGKQSILSVRLEQCPLQLNNPFNEYSKFDGKGHVGTTATKKIDVYLPLHTSQDKLQPMTVVTIANAKVHDLIGLICWQYTTTTSMPTVSILLRMTVRLTQIFHPWIPMSPFTSLASAPWHWLKSTPLPAWQQNSRSLSACSRGEEVSEEDPQIDIATVQDMLSSHHYKSFKVSMIHRLRFTTDVQLGISGDKVEIDPVTNQKASTKFWIKQKPVSIDSELLCACDLAEEKSPSHAIFKLTYLSNHDYKHFYFESDAATVNEIVLKVNYILESRASTARADYFAQKQKKLSRRTSFSFQKEKKSGQQ
ncbi:target of rapamycin complex 2 subunit MAPKAP1 isoform X6 [Egretta garzetta]|uniref:target of rapamycin complex 2 subunit MAPKAP1 isoform X6 n=1 Tax=Egretta garzetta TaxID=188379 RepID=UPI00163BAE56|nr:target of rapamycin complex 2 subunit MAPKAP1 isoform X6 [Egretta garzetta]